jgi:hypothetical protein
MPKRKKGESVILSPSYPGDLIQRNSTVVSAWKNLRNTNAEYPVIRQYRRAHEACRMHGDEFAGHGRSGA